MKIITTTTGIQCAISKHTGKRIALVPTMGCLHEGHLSLIRQAKQLADIVVVSIYVNPLQFAVHEDLDNYPQPFSEDAKLCQQEGVDILFRPQNLYPKTGIQVSLHVANLSQCLCGASRLGHFDGVVTVVNILFNLIRPNIAIFGSKDLQQLSIIRRMVADLHMSITIIGCETVREADGLAKSSRNRYLNKQERQQAVEISAAMHAMQQAAAQGLLLPKVLQTGEQHLKQHDITAEYLEIRHPEHLHTITTLKDHAAQIFVAAAIGSARLIDNMPLFPTTTTEEHSPCV